MTRAWFAKTQVLGWTLLGVFLTFGTARADDDWPMWRYDAGRTAASPNELPSQLRLLWRKSLTPRQQAWDDPLNLDLMTYDRVFEPIVVDGRLLIGFNDRDKLVALDADTGTELWSAYAEAPVRMPPAANGSLAFFSSDDGYLYCVDVATGRQKWRFRGAPNNQHAIGNRRLTSAWPARGGPVVRDDIVYFTSSIWPFMGTFIYALDAQSGQLLWVNDGTGSQYIKQPHSAPSFAGVAPQGVLVATSELLIVPGGRSVPAVFDRDNGQLRYFEINAGGKGTGGSFVSADEQHFYVHTRLKGTRAFDLKKGRKTAFMPSQPVLHDGLVYSAETEDGKSCIRAYDRDQKVAWEIDADGTGDLILAGNQLVAAGGGALSVIRLPVGEKPASVVRSIKAPGQIERLLVADRKLFAVTLDGQIMAFGDHATAAEQPDSVDPDPAESVVASTHAREVVSDLLSSATAEGYAIWYGSSSSELAAALCSDSPFEQLAIVDSDGADIDQTRRRLDGAELYGPVTVHLSEPGAFMAPKYVANMVFVDESITRSADSALFAKLYESVRPYGGVMYLMAEAGRQELAQRLTAIDLEQAVVDVGQHGVTVRRRGALPGAADWTHQYGDVANTIKSNDRRVKLPLGVLWFGGSSNMDVLPRHGHGPPEQVVGGRLFIQGMNSLSARDVYTGRVLWKREFKDLGTFDVYYDATYEDAPLNPKYNQVHIPGANGRGTNYVVTSDRIYIVEGGVCHVLDPVTGETMTDIRLPKLGHGDAGDQASDEGADWGYIGVYKDVLIGGLGFAKYRSRRGLSFESDNGLKLNRAGFGSKSLDRAASVALVGFDRHTGELLWRADALHSFWHNGIVAGGEQIYCLDRNPSQVEQAMQRRGKPNPKTYRIVALDYRTGKPRWEVSDEIFGTWLGYSEEFDLLLQAGAAASDRLTTESDQGMAVYSAADGSLKWKNESLEYTGPCILHHDLIITNTNSYAESAGAFYLRDGKPKLVPNPLTGQLQPWTLTRAYGCNNIIASENMLTFRSGAAGYYDLLTGSGTGNFGGFKSGCTSNLVVANGVLNAPDYTRTCSCAYQNQTSLALVHMPDVDVWSVNTAASVNAPGESIDRIGINFGAPGDRRDRDGLLWLDYPLTGGPSPRVSIEINDQAKGFLHHSSTYAGSEIPWVFASGVEDVTDIRVELKLQSEYQLNTGIPVLHTDDSAEENEEGEVNLKSRDVELKSQSGNQTVGLRFNNILLERDAKVRDAYIQFTARKASVVPASLTIAAEDTGDALRFNKDPHDLSSRRRTETEIGWIPKPWLIPESAAEVQRTPNLAPLIESVIRRPDWVAGNSIAILISGVGPRIGAAYREGIEKAPKLVIDAQQSSRGDEAAVADKYRVRLFFAVPGRADSEERIFDVYVQDQRVLEGVRIANTAGGNNHLTHVLEDVPIASQLRVRLVPKQGRPVISGIELVRQSDDPGR